MTTTRKPLLVAALSIAAAMLGATVGCAQDTGASSSQAPRFTLPADPSTPVLKLTFRCGDCARTGIYTLTSDGKLVRILSEGPGHEVRQEKVLSRERTEQLVALVVSRGVMSSSSAKIHDALRARGGQKMVADGGSVALEVHLATLDQDGKHRDNPSVRLGVPSLGAQAHAYPDIQEIAAMQLLYQEFAKEVG